MNESFSVSIHPIKKWLDIEQANEVLITRMDHIRTVSAWAECMNYTSLPEFRQSYKLCFGKACKDAMVEIRLNRAIELIKSSDLKLFFIAQKVGLCNEFALYKYFMRHLGIPPSFYKPKRTMNFLDL